MRVFTIPLDVGFLSALVKAILAGGFPSPETPAPGPADLPLWTILVPTRRAARSLQQSFLDAGGACLLPSIRPIGDIDEDLLEPFEIGGSSEDASMPPAVSQIGRELLLVTLIEAWAGDNPQERLAQEIRQSPARALGLARSLAELVDSFETEEASLAALSELFQSDLALHRLAILDFLAIIRERLPVELARRNRLGPMERRGRLIRAEAARLKSVGLKGPIIAAGSTGTIPATAELLKTIAELDQGAVVLPGLDPFLDEASWNAVSPQHPQFALKRLLDSWRLRRGDVACLPGLKQRRRPRAWLASEIMRPAETTPGWRRAVKDKSRRIATGMTGVHLIEARHRREEAIVIALILREALDRPEAKAALVTPDRELARRVKAELRRWNIAIDNSAGEPLIRSPQGSLLALLIDCVGTISLPPVGRDQGWGSRGLSTPGDQHHASTGSAYGAAELAALIHHPLLRLGLSEAAVSKAVSIFELAVLRYGGRSATPGEFRSTVDDIRTLAATDRHLPTAVFRLSADDWSFAADFARRMDEALAALAAFAASDQTAPIASHLQTLLDCAEALCASPDRDHQFWSGNAGETLAELAEALFESASLLPERPFAHTAPLILDYLNAAPVRAHQASHARLSILGLLEARLVRPDIVIMGGLNEAKWPAQPDSGPWLNRPMRSTLGLAMPERHIGLTAHDFAQGFGAETVYLVWSRRVGDAPAVPSRWILRLQMLLKAAGVAADEQSARWLAWARGLDMAPDFAPISMPKPKPPRPSRPKSLSFTDVETLIRDPYAIYARKIIRVEPLPGIAEPADAALRGQLIHEALNRFASIYTAGLPTNAVEELIRIGRDVFAPHLGEPDVAGFWWRRFLRIAPWFIEQDRTLRAAVRRTASEVPASLSFSVAGEPFRLTGRADRIDMLDDRNARIIDYKTGEPPSARQVEIGLAPQLTLEAAVLELGGFECVEPIEAEALLYVRLSGGEPPGELRSVGGSTVGAMAREHLAKLQNLLAGYACEDAAYIPRHIMKTESEASPFDHLSRWGEWARKEAVE